MSNKYTCSEICVTRIPVLWASKLMLCWSTFLTGNQSVSDRYTASMCSRNSTSKLMPTIRGFKQSANHTSLWLGVFEVSPCHVIYQLALFSVISGGIKSILAENRIFECRNGPTFVGFLYDLSLNIRPIKCLEFSAWIFGILTRRFLGDSWYPRK